jgi:protocatechuate 3,4-dioxygenase beta subunit
MFFFGGGGNIVGAGKTDEDGEFLFQALAAGSYTVKACYPGYFQARTDQPVAVEEDGKAAFVRLTLTYGQTVSGTVVDDLEQPVNDAKVQVLPHSGRPGFGMRGGDFRSRMEAMAAPPSDLKESSSAADGSFRVSGLEEAKSYDVFAEAQGLVPAALREVDAGSADLRLVMVRPGQIRGRVIGAITGKPVTEFTIRIVPAPDEGDRRDRRFGRGGFGMGDLRRGDRPPPRNATSKIFEAFGDLMRNAAGPSLAPTEREDDFHDRGGNFELTGIVPSRYRLCVSADGYAPALTDPIVVEKGEVVRGLDISLGPGAIMTGKVLSSSSGPVGGAEISVRAEGERDDDIRLLLDTLNECETGSEGSFRITNLPAGDFTLRAMHEDYPSVTSDPLNLTEGQHLPDVVLTFPPGARIIGTALDAAGAPMADTNVLCRGEGGGRRGGFERDRTDDEGHFEFKDLRAGTYTLSLFTGMRGFRFGRGGDDDGSMEVTVEAGETAEILLQDLAPQGTTVQGIITDDSGPVGSGFIMVSPVEERGSMRNGMIAEDGTYKVEGVPPGTNRFTMRFSTGSSFESSTLEFDIPDMSDVLLDIALPGGRISGTVLDAASRAPLGDVRVSLSSEGQGREDRGGRMRGRFGGGGNTVVTDKNGSFKFRLLAPGTYNIEARPTGDLDSGDGFGYYTAEVLGLSLAEGQLKDNVRVLLGPGGALQVRVVDETNTPFEGAMVTAYEEGTSPTGRQGGIRERTDEEGLAVLNRVKPGVYNLNIQARQMGQQVVGGVYVAAGQTTMQDVTVTSGFQVSIRLKSADDQPVEGADVTLKNAQGLNMSVRGRSRSNVYSLGTLPPGNYSVEAAWEGKTGSASFNVQEEGTLSVTLR